MDPDQVGLADCCWPECPTDGRAAPLVVVFFEGKISTVCPRHHDLLREGRRP